MAKHKIDDSLPWNQFIEKQFGKTAIVTADKITSRKRNVLPTILSLDIALGGGLPDGIIVLFSGKPKAGKTTTCLVILKNAINLGRPAFYVDIEHRCKPELLHTINGLDLSKLHMVGTQADISWSAVEWLSIIERIIKDNRGAVVVLDSIAVLSTMTEQSEALGANADMAGAPKLLASFFRRMVPIIDQNNAILICLSQLQTNREPGSHKKFIEKGGMAVQYACSTWINVDWFKLWEKDKNTGAIAGQDMQIRIISSAMGSPFVPCELPLRFGRGIDIIGDAILQGENLGLIDVSGSWLSSKLWDHEKFQGQDALSTFLTDHPDKLEQLVGEVRKVMLPHVSAVAERKDSQDQPAGT